jgi:hypothetical protein
MGKRMQWEYNHKHIFHLLHIQWTNFSVSMSIIWDARPCGLVGIYIISWINVLHPSSRFCNPGNKHRHFYSRNKFRYHMNICVIRQHKFLAARLIIPSCYKLCSVTWHFVLYKTFLQTNLFSWMRQEAGVTCFSMRLKVLTTVKMSMSVFWLVTPWERRTAYILRMKCLERDAYCIDFP